MSNGTNTPFGLRPVRTLTGAPLTDGCGLVCSIATGYATNLIPGDPVVFSGTASASGYPGIIRGAAGVTNLGIFGSILQITKNPPELYAQIPSWPASTATTGETLCLVYTDPNLVYEVQTTATGIVAANVGLNANWIVNEGSLTTNLSGVALDQASLDVTATLNMKVIGLAKITGNAFGNTYNIAEVVINNHLFKGGTGTLGS